MITLGTINNRPATIVFLDDNMDPTSEEAATIVKVIFDDGEILFLRPDRSLTESE
jgi:hypothetical protein